MRKFDAMKSWQQRKRINNNVIKNKDSAEPEQTCKSSKNINGKLQIRVKWVRLNTTQKWPQKQNKSKK